MRRGVVATVAALATLAGCRPGLESATRTDTVASSAPPPLVVDTGAAPLLELWTLVPGRRAADDDRRLRRIVEHLHADVAIAPGFVEGALLAAGDGRTLVALLRWRDSASAARARPVIAERFGLRLGDTTRAARAAGAVASLRATRRVGDAPVLVADSGVLVLARFARKTDASAAVLVPVVGDELAALAAADRTVRGGVVLLSPDSATVATLVQARAVNGLELPAADGAPLPPWAPFATRDRRSVLVVTVVRQRDAVPVVPDAP